MKKITVKNGKIIKHNFTGKVLDLARKNINDFEDGKYKVYDKKEYLDFKKV